jgi:hypothetical protein
MASAIEEAAYALRYNVFAKTTTSAKETASMKCSRAEVHCKTHVFPAVETQLTSFSEILSSRAFVRLGLKERLRLFIIYVNLLVIPPWYCVWSCTCFSDTGSCAMGVTTPMIRW